MVERADGILAVVGPLGIAETAKDAAAAYAAAAERRRIIVEEMIRSGRRLPRPDLPFSWLGWAIADALHLGLRTLAGTAAVALALFVALRASGLEDIGKQVFNPWGMLARAAAAAKTATPEAKREISDNLGEIAEVLRRAGWAGCEPGPRPPAR
jgi:hypothetical protein